MFGFISQQPFQAPNNSYYLYQDVDRFINYKFEYLERQMYHTNVKYFQI